MFKHCGKSYKGCPALRGDVPQAQKPHMRDYCPQKLLNYRWRDAVHWQLATEIDADPLVANLNSLSIEVSCTKVY